ncbi:MAG: hypothetical protein Q4F57_01320 [Weeksellaceae bacterium]|nr:hypothetical protein [Weeksellaceae bacterium]
MVSLDAQFTLNTPDNLVFEATQDVRDIFTDDHENLYFITATEVLWKMDRKTGEIFSHKPVFPIKNIQTYNPFFLSYTNDLLQIVILDSKLNPIREDVYLFKHGNWIPGATIILDYDILATVDRNSKSLVLFDYRNEKIIRRVNLPDEININEILRITYSQKILHLYTHEQVYHFDFFLQPFAISDHLAGSDFMGRRYLRQNQNTMEVLELGKTAVQHTIQADCTPTQSRLLRNGVFVLCENLVYFYPFITQKP